MPRAIAEDAVSFDCMDAGKGREGGCIEAGATGPWMGDGRAMQDAVAVERLLRAM